MLADLRCTPVGDVPSRKYDAAARVTATLHGEPVSTYAVFELVGDRVWS